MNSNCEVSQNFYDQLVQIQGKNLEQNLSDKMNLCNKIWFQLLDII